MKSTHWGAAFDVRGLDQDLGIHGSTAGASNLLNYREGLDTTYYGDGDGRANGIVNQTQITDGDAFSERTSLRLNIGLGPSQLYAPSMK